MVLFAHRETAKLQEQIHSAQVRVGVVVFGSSPTVVLGLADGKDQPDRGGYAAAVIKDLTFPEPNRPGTNHTCVTKPSLAAPTTPTVEILMCIELTFPNTAGPTPII
jgi:hypothetical protein